MESPSREEAGKKTVLFLALYLETGLFCFAYFQRHNVQYPPDAARTLTEWEAHVFVFRI